MAFQEDSREHLTLETTEHIDSIQVATGDLTVFNNFLKELPIFKQLQVSLHLVFVLPYYFQGIFLT
jgi:hypothetical protein